MEITASFAKTAGSDRNDICGDVERAVGIAESIVGRAYVRGRLLRA
ncbi:hypothetical protein [Rhizobium chutanense]|nr:hypothetical protein [Rhizobium chutanense]